ncbi:MAG TPA: LysR substrate-binding domain-containing protein, partial [Stellaceae bacterium]|nr:LysR substrate-binding domain-containing protein [Stellaceae bacterium]
MLEHRIKLRHLSCFLEVASRQSFGGAARHLHLSQPAVSKAIAELEAILETALFERSRRGVFLTPEGDAFRSYAGSTLAALRQGIDTLAAGVGQGSGVISVGVLPTVAGKLLPLAVQEAKAAGLDATLRLLTGPNEYLLERLREGELDIVVGRLGAPAAMQGLSFEHLYSESVVFVARPGHPLTLGGRAVTLPDLVPFTVLLPGAGAVIRPAVEEMLVAYGGLRLPDAIETVSPTFGRRYVRT